MYSAVLPRSLMLFFQVRLFPTKSLQVTARLENLSCLRLLSQTGERNAVKVNFFSMHISMCFHFFESYWKLPLISEAVLDLDFFKVAALEAGSIKPEQVEKEKNRNFRLLLIFHIYIPCICIDISSTCILSSFNFPPSYICHLQVFHTVSPALAFQYVSLQVKYL